MGSQIRQMGISIWLCILSFSFVCVIAAMADGEGSVVIEGRASVAETDDDFICATLDWWPPEKCDYGTCSWGHSSLLNLDLSNNVLLNAIKAFSPLKLRLGGTLQDKVTYQSNDLRKPCGQFVKSPTEMFGFTQGCLPIQRWDELNSFFQKTGVEVIFGLNALAGRSRRPDGLSTGAWDPSNAESLIRYTVNKGYTIHGWELGNELSGSGVGTSVAADQYASDFNVLYKMVQDLYKNNESKPSILAPGGFFDSGWFSDFVNKTPVPSYALTHHIYNLGPGVDEHLVEKILDPTYLDGEAKTFSSLQSILKSSGTSAVAWVGEAGGAYNSGRNHVTNAFVFSFWYLDQLGMAASFDTKTYCRQTLIGGNYGLLDTTTFVPNPDYYSALLWHRLMGRKVLSTTFSGTKKIRAYAHCAKPSRGITLLLINLDGNTTVEAKTVIDGTRILYHKHRYGSKQGRRHHVFSNGETEREEYHLTAEGGDLQSQKMLLNGKILTIDSFGGIPKLEAVNVKSSEPIRVDPYSIVFVHIPDLLLPACRQYA
ncbi:hypothetical protein Nepgr_032518 [Nepenthes gracilis]|uniref:Heparanase-like protein 3 n=1 Tax=Nepenthes gracilis TaxID=150966 RepID=A0AAD3Y7R2_NEPGR|nr:hypothetical protein Nepgr_032518 [Nepenthes gracilis]